MILLTEVSELRERVVETFCRFGIQLNLRVETGTLDSAKRLVAQNMGVGIVPSLCVTREDKKPYRENHPGISGRSSSLDRASPSPIGSLPGVCHAPEVGNVTLQWRCTVQPGVSPALEAVNIIEWCARPYARIFSLVVPSAALMEMEGKTIF
jgi:hypothetical protein